MKINKYERKKEIRTEYFAVELTFAEYLSILSYRCM